MKRQTKKKVNAGPKNPHNRKEAKAKAEEFIKNCEASLIRFIDQTIQEKRLTWLDLGKELQERYILLRKTYPNHKGKVAIAVHNVELALKSIREEKATSEAKQK